MKALEVSVLVLKKVIEQHQLKQVDLAKNVELSPAAINQLANHGIYPKKIDKQELQVKIYNWINEQGVVINCGLFDEVVTESGNSQQPSTTSQNEDYDMLLKKQQLKQATKQAFKIMGEPFRDPVNSDDLFLSPDMQYIRETLLAATKYPNFLAAIGESGSGKSTLRKDLKNRLSKGSDTIIVIEPYVLAMEDNDIKGKTLKST